MQVLDARAARHKLRWWMVVVPWLIACAPHPAPVLAPVLRPCTLPGVQGDVQCGSVLVSEDREAPRGRPIALRVVVLRALGPDPAPDPVFGFAGGPGIGAATNASAFAEAWSHVRQRRDLILVDQRGTGGSNQLTCHGVMPDDPSFVFQSILPPDIVAACRKELETRADLTRYTTAVAVQDIEDVRAALGYKRINLWGESYGTRTALEYLRRYQPRVRSVILDGVMPHDFKMPLRFAADAQHALDRVLAECEASPDCRRAFPNGRDAMRSAVARLDSAPVLVAMDGEGVVPDHRVRLTRTAFGYALRGMLYGKRVQWIPRLLHDAAQHGEFRPFARYYARRASWLVDSTSSAGMYLTIVCAEDVPRIRPSEADSLTRDTFIGAGLYHQYRRACDQWPRAPVPDDFDRPIDTDVPILLLSGAHDPVTPPQYAADMARQLRHSLHVVSPAGGHGVADRPCNRVLVQQFLDAGSVRKLATTCRDDDEQVAFSVTGDPPL